MLPRTILGWGGSVVPRPKTYVVELTDEQRASLLGLVRKGEAQARTLTRARILLLSAEGKTDSVIGDMLKVNPQTVRNIRKRFAEEGLEAALRERPRPGARPKLDSAGEAVLVALACSEPPGGRAVWTMQLLADRLVELGVVEAISDETVRRVMKKNALKPWQKKQWCIAQVTAEFVWRMEDVLELYAEPYDPQRPVVCFDERPYQLLGDTRTPLPMGVGQVRRVDYEYERHGNCNLFLAFQPLTGWRQVHVTERRRGTDFAWQMKWLVDEVFPQAEQVRVVVDNLNIHTPAALYQTFSAAEARRLTRKLEFHYTPKHASWLNMVEIEFSILARQCLDRRIPDVESLRREVQAWADARNAARATVQWRFTSADARLKLHRLYHQ
ncbi:MAG: IS630 family transposase [candidate division KSB1 bacterium]|nr:IS630 family transposase [candidate division KSB1 bacterium]